jgi:hypothetical protein
MVLIHLPPAPSQERTVARANERALKSGTWPVRRRGAENADRDQYGPNRCDCRHASPEDQFAKAAYALGFGDLAAAKRPAILLGALALLGFAAATAYLV